MNMWITGIWSTTIDWDTFSSSYYSFGESQSHIAVKTMAAGTHNLKLQYRADGGGVENIYNWSIGFVVLGR
jgi:hypothetical protein